MVSGTARLVEASSQAGAVTRARRAQRLEPRASACTLEACPGTACTSMAGALVRSVGTT